MVEMKTDYTDLNRPQSTSRPERKKEDVVLMMRSFQMPNVFRENVYEQS